MLSISLNKLWKLVALVIHGMTKKNATHASIIAAPSI
jgi:hypothetical protein